MRSHIGRREPKTLDQLSRAQVAARVYSLRSALDTLADQSDMDGGALYECTGRMKRELIVLEGRLRALDSQAPDRPFAAALIEAGATDRLRTAAGELAEVVRDIAITGAHARRGTQEERFLAGDILGQSAPDNGRSVATPRLGPG